MNKQSTNSAMKLTQARLHRLTILAALVLTLMATACADNGLNTADNLDVIVGDTIATDTPIADTSEPTATYRVMSFNVMCSVCDMSADPWEERLVDFGDLFGRLEPDLIGLQEFILPDEVDQILAVAPGFAAHYHLEDANFFTYPDAVVLYRTARFELIESGEYWLSPTPDVAGSLGFSPGQTLPRVVVWVHLKDKQINRELYFATTHYDSTHPHQEYSAPLMLEKTAPWAATMPVIQTGDFNTEPRDPAFLVLTRGIDATGFAFQDAFALSPGWRGEANLDPAPEYDPTNRIDHIFVAGSEWTATDWIADLFKYGPGPKFPSDHRAVMAVLELAL